MRSVEIASLPCSLDPLPGETLVGFLLRLSHRNEQSPQRIAARSGLLAAISRTPNLSQTALLELTPPAVEVLTAHWRLTVDEAHSLTLRTAAPNYPPLHPLYLGRQRNITQMIHDGWVLIHSSRYCPQCLAGDDTVIQREHGGAWQSTWRLPITFACLRHNRLLESRCPHCNELAQSAGRRADGTSSLPGRLVPTPAVTLHPAQCRTVLPELGQSRSRTRRRYPCAGRLDTGIRAVRPTLELVALQQRLLELSRTAEATTSSMGAPASMSEYVTDLRTLIMLAGATWPTVRSLAPDFPHFTKIENYLEQQHSLLDRRARFVTPLPTDVDTCAALLLLADTFANSPPPNEIIKELCSSPLAPTVRARLLLQQPFCSVGFRSILSTSLDLPQHKKSGRRPAFPQHIDQSAQYEPRHVPQLLPTHWLSALQGIEGVPKVQLHRDAAIRLIQMVDDIPRVQAGSFLGIPYSLALTGGGVISTWLHRTSKGADYFRVLSEIAESIAAAPLIDYRFRREALREWTIPEADWATIAAEVTRRQQSRPRRLTTWAKAEYLGATIYVWSQVVSSEPNLHPLRLSGGWRATDKNRSPLRYARAISNRWPLPYADLKHVLDSYSLDVIDKLNQAHLFLEPVR